MPPSLNSTPPARRASQAVIRWALAFLGAMTVNAAVPQSGDPGPDATTNQVVVPFEWSRGRILLEARANETRPVRLMLDTGYSLTTMSRQAIDELGLEQRGRVTIEGIAGRSEAATFRGVAFVWAGGRYAPRRVAALSPDQVEDWPARDGILGAGFFRRFVVEIDTKGRRLVLHEPRRYRAPGGVVTLPLTYNNTTPVIDAELVLDGRETVRGRFELDTGCNGGLCVGSDFVEVHGLTDATEARREGARRGVGGEAATRVGRLPAIRLGTHLIRGPTANLFVQGSPSDPGYAGHIGMQILRELKVTFDYSRDAVHLERLP